MSTAGKIEVGIGIATISLMMTMWYFFWVKPHDEMIFWIMDCTSEMQGQGSPEELHKECHKKFLQSKGISKT